ncbi:MAG: hypothetical protein IPP40_10595 [bacterium]|nr:hypothetical protein [bacterium]
MRKAFMLCAACLAMSWSVSAGDGGQIKSVTTPEQNLTVSGSSAEKVLDAAFRQIELYDQNQWDVPKELYDFYFKLDRLVNPQIYAEAEERMAGGGAMDQLLGTCPGTIFYMPEEDDLDIRTCGSTTSSTNRCTYPNGRYGRDVVAELDLPSSGELRISTCGSSFDTYLCLFEDACCGDESGELIESNNNDPFTCGGQRLTSAIATCVGSGTYYIVVDGASPAAHGSYCLTIEYNQDCD